MESLQRKSDCFIKIRIKKYIIMMHSGQNQEKVRNSIPPQPPLWTVCDTMTTRVYLPWALSPQDRVLGLSECGPTATEEAASQEVPTIGTRHSKLRRHMTVYLLVHWLRSKTRNTRGSVLRGIQTLIFGLAIQSAAIFFSSDVWCLIGLLLWLSNNDIFLRKISNT